MTIFTRSSYTETEKYAHVTFFFNGGREAPFSQEERLMVPSPKVATYDLQPEMSADGVGKAVSQWEEGSVSVVCIGCFIRKK